MGPIRAGDGGAADTKVSPCGAAPPCGTSGRPRAQTAPWSRNERFKAREVRSAELAAARSRPLPAVEKPRPRRPRNVRVRASPHRRSRRPQRPPAGTPAAAPRLVVKRLTRPSPGPPPSSPAAPRCLRPRPLLPWQRRALLPSCPRGGGASLSANRAEPDRSGLQLCLQNAHSG